MEWPRADRLLLLLLLWSWWTVVVVVVVAEVVVVVEWPRAGGVGGGRGQAMCKDSQYSHSQQQDSDALGDMTTTGRYPSTMASAGCSDYDTTWCHDDRATHYDTTCGVYRPRQRGDTTIGRRQTSTDNDRKTPMTTTTVTTTTGNHDDSSDGSGPCCN
ncbi:hypothetical protein EDB89DRAFT_1906090 [Lactarius sanguifluus]|nr:hypothetical protein EDB89DRAFT_1906090 [Lactarius sanguifluus]